MLHHERVAGHQMWPCDSSQLVIRKVPRLDTKDNTDGTAFHVCFALGGIELYGGQETLPVFGVIIKNVRAEFDFAAGFINELSHFESRMFGEFIDVGPHELRGSRYDLGSLFI